VQKRVLITAGPVYVKIDDIRFIGNLATGRTGFLLAKEFLKAGFKVDLFINPAGLTSGEIAFVEKNCRVIKFRWLEEFVRLAGRKCVSKYAVIVHSAAVADYKPAKVKKGKIPSGKKTLILKLKPAEKVIKILRRNKKSLLVQFKLESRTTKKTLINKALLSMKKNKADMVVANLWESVEKRRFVRYIISLGTKPLKVEGDKFYKVFVQQVQTLIKERRN